jgi:C-terminal processing protease CtpA/Prc
MTPTSLSPKQRTEILAAVKKSVLKHHFNVAGVNYNDWAGRFDERSPTLLGVVLEEFEDGVRKALAELGSSHTVFYHERTNRLLPQHSINATLRAFAHDGQQRWHFLDIFEGGPADIAGIKRGDMLVAVDGIPYAPPATPPFRIGETHRIAVSTGLDEQSREIAVSVPFRKGTKNRPPIVEPKSPIHEVVAPKTGLLKIPYFPGSTGISFANALDLAIRDLTNQGCDRLIIDLRGNIGGSLGFARLASYLCPGQVPIGHSLTPARLRKGYTRESLPRVPMPRTTAEFVWALARFALRDKSVMLLTQGLGPQPFHGRVIILVNEWTNSAAEMLASFASENRLATVIGVKTAGNVLGAVNHKVGAGYWLRIPVFGWYTPNGKCAQPNFLKLPDDPLANSLAAACRYPGNSDYALIRRAEGVVGVRQAPRRPASL